MRALALRLGTAERWLASASRASRRIQEVSPVRVVAVAIAAEWCVVLGLALVVRHNGWIYYQGGDQLWYYSSGWSLAHGQLPLPLVGYLWSALLAPLALIAGANLVSALPAIVLVDTLILLPVALAAVYGIARLIGGRLFACWALLIWIVVPLVGIKFTDAGYHQRFTELILPQTVGLTAMADFPTMVAAAVSAYFCARVLFREPDLVDAAAAGAAAGIAIGIKPSTSLFLAGPFLAFAVARRFRAGSIFVLALLPAVATLALWKWRGYGFLPLVHSAAPVQLASDRTLTALRVPDYAHFDWSHFTHQLDLLREHFWSGRVIEWSIVAGVIGLARRSPRAAALVGGWFAAFAIVKGGYSDASIEDSSLLRIMIPTIPAFVVMLAALPYLLPGVTRPRPIQDAARPRVPRRFRIGAVAAALIVSAAIPFVAIASAQPARSTPRTAVIQTPLIPTDIELHVRAVAVGNRVTIRWPEQRLAGGPVFYHIFRTPSGAAPFDCDTSTPARRCVFSNSSDLGTATAPEFVDRNVPSGSWEYRVGVAANWLNDPAYGDVYILSRAAAVTVG